MAKKAETRKRPIRKALAPVPTELVGERMGLEYVDIDEIERWPRNPKKHDIQRLKGSMRDHGFTIPIARDATTQRMVAGHGRLQALRELRDEGEDAPRRILVVQAGVRKQSWRWFAPVLVGLSFLNEEQAEQYLLSDNRLVEAGGWDPEMLTRIFKSMPQAKIDKAGFSDAEVSRFAAIAAKQLAGPQPPQPVSFMAKTKEHKCPSCGHAWST